MTTTLDTTTGHWVSDIIDAYKPTMSQLQFERHYDAEVVFMFKNRGAQKLAQYVDVDELQRRLDTYKVGWQEKEVDFLATQERIEGGALFSKEYLSFLRANELPPVTVVFDQELQDIAVSTTGQWALVTFWETIVMSEVNELYFEAKIKNEGLDITSIYREGNRRLSKKIKILQAREDILFADFGTRRHFGKYWHQHVVSRLVEECPKNLLGVSSIGLAQKFNLMPIGTCAHEMDMVYAALSDKAGRNPLDGHREMMHDWVEMYGENLSTALPDTFGSKLFFSTMTYEQAKHWKAIRHDSGDPVQFGEQVIEFYREHGIDPITKTVVFSDGLDIDTIVMLTDYFKGRVNVVFGWGTTLTNDLGLKPLNIVMKATEVNGVKTVKLSDNEGKHTGPRNKIKKYKELVARQLHNG